MEVVFKNLIDQFSVFDRASKISAHANDKTPAEACGIEVKGKNKWIIKRI